MAASAIASLPFINIFAILEILYPVSILKQGITHAVSVNFDRYIRAGDSAYLAADAARRIVNLGVKVTLHRDGLGHGQDLHGADPDTQLTTLTMVFVYRYMWHCYSSVSLILRRNGFPTVSEATCSAAEPGDQVPGDSFVPVCQLPH